MDPFFLYVSIGALVLLLVVLTIFGVMLTTLNNESVFPPVQSACPDHWDVSSNPNYCGVPKSSGRNKGRLVYESASPNEVNKTDPNNIGICTTGSTFGCKPSPDLLITPKGTNQFQYLNLGTNNTKWNSANGLYPGKTALCAQNAWANMMGISWDGVSNYNGC